MKKHLKIIIPVLLVVLVVAYAVNGNYTISAYLNNGGATADYAVLCSVKNNQTGREKNIYWNYHCTGAKVEWNSEDTVTINGVKLNVNKDTYDYRKD